MLPLKTQLAITSEPRCAATFPVPAGAPPEPRDPERHFRAVHRPLDGHKVEW